MICRDARISLKLTTAMVSPILLMLITATMASAAEESDWKIPANKENFHVFLLMGQSNMTGGGRVMSEDRKAVPRVLFIPPKAMKWEPASHPLHRPGRGFGLGLSFAKAYLKRHPGISVGLIPLGRGGAQINRLHKGTEVYAEAMKKAAIAQQSGVIKGVLWH